MSRFSLLRLGALATIVLVLVSACGGSSDTADNAAPEALVAQTVSGADFDFASLDGQPALVWFWAPW